MSNTLLTFGTHSFKIGALCYHETIITILLLKYADFGVKIVFSLENQWFFKNVEIANPNIGIILSFSIIRKTIFFHL